MIISVSHLSLFALLLYRNSFVILVVSLSAELTHTHLILLKKKTAPEVYYVSGICRSLSSPQGLLFCAS